MPAQVELLVLPVEILSLSALYQHVTYLKETGQNVEPLEMRLWQEFSMPLSTLVMVIVAIPFVFGPLREATAGKRILQGSLLGLPFILSAISWPISEPFLHLSAALTVLSPIAVLCGLALLVVPSFRLNSFSFPSRAPPCRAGPRPKTAVSQDISAHRYPDNPSRGRGTHLVDMVPCAAVRFLPSAEAEGTPITGKAPRAPE